MWEQRLSVRSGERLPVERRRLTLDRTEASMAGKRRSTRGRSEARRNGGEMQGPAHAEPCRTQYFVF